MVIIMPLSPKDLLEISEANKNYIEDTQNSIDNYLKIYFDGTFASIPVDYLGVFKNAGRVIVECILEGYRKRGWTRVEYEPHDDYIYFEYSPLDGDREDFLNKEIKEFNLSVRTSYAMRMINAKRIRDLYGKSDQELLKIKHFGKSSLRELKTEFLDKLRLYEASDSEAESE